MIDGSQRRQATGSVFRLLVPAVCLGMSCSAVAKPALHDALPPQLRVCEDEAETPPYTYRTKAPAPTNRTAASGDGARDGSRDGGQDGGRIDGFSVAVIRAIGQRIDRPVTITLMPWARCQYEVARGTHHLALNATFNEDRAKTYLFSRPYYQGRDFIFYSRTRFPDGIIVTQLEQLRLLKLCGINGYNYAPLAMPTGAIDLSAKDYRQLSLRLYYGTCDAFVEKIEIARGFARQGFDMLGQSWMAYARLAPIPTTDFFMLITRADPGPALKRAIDRGLEALEASGQMAAFRKTYLD